MSFVVARLPKAGLGNKLFVWANAFLFASLQQKKMVVFGWINYSKSTLTFWDKNSRIYFRYFNNKPNICLLLIYFFFKIFFKKSISNQINYNKIQNAKIYEFSKVPHWKDFFYGLRENHSTIKKGFFEMLNSSIKSEFEKLEAPVIAVHVRMGDFRNLKQGEDFKKVGGVRTPLDYFINLINNIREKTHVNLPVSIFSDGTPDELKPLLNLKNVSLIKNSKDIIDMLHISKADIIITSAGSTFSFWSAFFSKAIVFIHPDHFHSYIRPQEINNYYFEGPTPLHWDNLPELLEKNLQTLKSKYITIK